MGHRDVDSRRKGSKTLTKLGKIYFVKTTKKNLVDPEKPEKTYAMAQHRAEMDLDELGEHIATHGCNYDEGDIVAIIKKTMKCIRELLCDGYILRLGDLGRFYITVQSRGVCESVIDPETDKKPVFTANDITRVNVNWSRSEKMQSDELMRNITFEETITAKAKAAMIKAKKAAMAAGTYDKDVEFVTDSGSTGENTGDGDINDDGYEVHE